MESTDSEQVFDDRDAVNGSEIEFVSERESCSEDPVTPNSPGYRGSPAASICSTASTISDDSVELDTDVFLSSESVQAMAQTVGAQLDDETASILAETVINKLRHVTLLAMQFTRHDRASGLRMSDFTKAEKINDSSYSLGYDFSHKFPEYLDFGNFCTEFEGVDIDVYKVIGNPSINELTEDENADPVLLSHFVNHHDKLSRDYDERHLYPNFSNILNESNMHQCLAEDWDYREQVDSYYTNGQVNGFCTNGNDPAESHGGQSPQILPDYIEMSGNYDTNYAPNYNDAYEALSRPFIFENNGMVTAVSSAHPSKKIKEEVASDAESMDTSEKDQISRTETSSDGKHPLAKSGHGAAQLMLNLPFKRESDIYKSGEFLLHQDVLGEDIFSEDCINEENEELSNANESMQVDSPEAKNYSGSQRSMAVVSPDITETRSCKRYCPSSAANNFSTSTSTDGCRGNEMKTSSSSSIPPTSEIKSEKQYSNNSSDDSDSSSEESPPEENAVGRGMDDDFEVVIDPEPEPAELELSDSEDEELSEDEDSDLVVSSEELPLEWGTYLQNFLVAFYDNEKRYETFEKCSYSYYIQDEEDEEQPVLTDFELLLKDIVKNGTFPVLHIITEFFHNFVGGKYLHVGNRQLRRIVAFVDSTLLCPLQLKVIHLKPLLALLLDMLTVPLPCKLQQCTSAAIFRVADRSPHPFNLELIRWITCFITAVLQRAAKLPLSQLTPTVKSRVCAAINLALGYEQRGVRPQRMHQWMKCVLLISENHYVVHAKSSENHDQKNKLYDAADSYLEEAIMKFIRCYANVYWKVYPDGELKPLFEKAMDNYGEKLTLIFSKPEILDSSSTSRRRRRRTKTPNDVELTKSQRNITHEFLVRPGFVHCKHFTKIRIPYAMCVL